MFVCLFVSFLSDTCYIGTTSARISNQFFSFHIFPYFVYYILLYSWHNLLLLLALEYSLLLLYQFCAFALHFSRLFSRYAFATSFTFYMFFVVYPPFFIVSTCYSFVYTIIFFLNVMCPSLFSNSFLLPQGKSSSQTILQFSMPNSSNKSYTLT